MKTKKEEIVQDVQAEEVLKLSELHLAKIKEIQEKQSESDKIASGICSKEFELDKLEAYLKDEKAKWLESKQSLVTVYEEIGTLNEKLTNEIKEKYGDIQLTNLETGEYILKQ